MNTSTPPTLYRDYATYLREHFPYKVQKISLNARLSCPNRDGTIGYGGCIYCNNYSFAPSYTLGPGTIAEQMQQGITFFSHKYPSMKYLAYFQAYTGTYGETKQLIRMYEEALEVPNVVGLIIGTRPDCVSRSLRDFLRERSRQTFIYIEYGLESTHDATLQRINRGHTFAQCCEAVEETVADGIDCGIHLILGLPGETPADFEVHAQRVSDLPITSLKVHQLQILKRTALARMYAETPSVVTLYSPQEYIEHLARFVALLNPNIYLDRFVSQSPPDLLIAPKWNIKNYIFTHQLQKYLREHNLSQGCLRR